MDSAAGRVTWFKVDDQAHDHRKFRGVSLAAVGLWTLAGSWSGSNRTDGFVPESVARRWPSSRRLACELVARGLWENVEHDGERGWRFHDWADWQPTKDEYETPTDQVRWRRKKQLQRDRLLCERICTRDRNRCRYCSTRVNWKDKRGATGGTYDHVDPDGDNSLENVVVACRRCNGRKRDRTPEEAAMTLLAVPGPRAESDLAVSGTEPDQGQENLTLAREAGRGQVGAESVLAATVPDLAVPVTNGSRNSGQ